MEEARWPSLGQVLLPGPMEWPKGGRGSHLMNMAAPTVTRWLKIWNLELDSGTLLSPPQVEMSHACYSCEKIINQSINQTSCDSCNLLFQSKAPHSALR